MYNNILNKLSVSISSGRPSSQDAANVNTVSSAICSAELHQRICCSSPLAANDYVQIK